MKRALITLLAAGLFTVAARAGDTTPAEYVRAKYGRHDLVLMTKNPKSLDPHEIAYLQELGSRWDPVEKCWWGFVAQLHAKDWRKDAVLITVPSPKGHWIKTETIK